MTEDLEFLKSHRFFCNLKQKQLESLFQHCRVISCPADSILFYPRERVDSLLLLLDGCLSLGEERAFGGNSLFLSSLALPLELDVPLCARESSKVLILKREPFLRWVNDNPQGLRRLGLRGGVKRNWGFPTAFWEQYGSLLPIKRSLGRMKPLLILRRWWPFWLIRQLPWIGLLVLSSLIAPARLLLIPASLWGVVALVIRYSNGLYITSSSVVAKIFKIRGFRRQTMKIPMEQVKALEIQRRGLAASIFKLGTLSIKTSSHQGSLVIPQLRKPQRAEELLNSLRKGKKSSRDRMALLKDAWQRRKRGETHPKEIFRGELYDAPSVKISSLRFRKSIFVLLKQIFLPLLILCIPLGALTFRLFPSQWNLPLLFISLFPLALILYRWEDWRNDIFKVEGDCVYDVDRKPLGKEMTRRQTQLSLVENVTAQQQGLFSWIFNGGSVRLILPGSSGELEFEDVADPWYVQDQLLRLRDEVKHGEKMAQMDERLEELLALADLLSQELS